jgi:hypothetical protein
LGLRLLLKIVTFAVTEHGPAMKVGTKTVLNVLLVSTVPVVMTLKTTTKRTIASCVVLGNTVQQPDEVVIVTKVAMLAHTSVTPPLQQNTIM